MLVVALLLVSLGFDTLAVAIGIGITGLARSRWFHVGAVFALCEGLMPIIGLVAGRSLTHALGALAQWVAAFLLIGLGAKAIREAITEGDEDDAPRSLLQGRGLLLAGLSVSLDELAIGFSLGFLSVSPGFAVGFIAVQAFVLTYLGLSLGQRLGRQMGERAELVSGCLLLLLGIAMLVNQATGGRLW